MGDKIIYKTHGVNGTNGLEVAIDSYKPKSEVIELRGRRISKIESPKHAWRRQERAAILERNNRDFYYDISPISYSRILLHRKPRNEHSPKYLRQDVEDPYAAMEDSYASRLDDFFDSLDWFLASSDRPKIPYPHQRDVATLTQKPFASLSKMLSSEVLQSYTLRQASEIQGRLDKEKLNISDMVKLGRFIIGTRSGKLYFVDHRVASILGKDDYSPEEFFEADGRYNFVHRILRAFTYVTLPIQELPLQPLKSGDYESKTRRVIQRIPHTLEQDILLGLYRDDPFESAVFGDRVSTIIERKLKH